jgi:uncharacterized OsmC-like protein
MNAFAKRQPAPANANVTSGNRVNGIDLDALGEAVGAINQDPAKAMVGFNVATAWTGQTGSETKVSSYTMGGERHARAFTIRTDEPLELLGENKAPNPQETLMAALNACMVVGYVAGAAVRGIVLDMVEIETSGELDLRGFLGLDDKVKPGYEAVKVVVRIRGDGTAEQFREIHEAVRKTSPNYFNVSRPVRIDAELKIET